MPKTTTKTTAKTAAKTAAKAKTKNTAPIIAETENIDKYSPENVRRWALRRLMEAADSNIDISRCCDPNYLSTLTPVQTDKIKRVIYGGHGNVVSIEPVAIVDMLKVAADIAGVKASKDAGGHKGAKLIIEDRRKPAAPETPASADPLSSLLGGKK